MMSLYGRLSLVASWLLFGLALGCGPLMEPRLDATSEETLRTSLNQMVSGMSEIERREFIADARSMLIMTGARSQQHVDALNGIETPPVEVLKPLHGMTVTEIRAKVADRNTRMAESFERSRQMGDEIKAKAHAGMPEMHRPFAP
ncbi:MULTISPECIES: hypothetical protein [Pirellulaceae]|nr:MULTISPECIES: hypothetical protein [Pirellulaceae]